MLQVHCLRVIIDCIDSLYICQNIGNFVWKARGITGDNQMNLLVVTWQCSS